MLGPLADRRYRHLFLAQVVALFGTGLTTVGLALLAHDLAGAAAGQVLGTALALKMVAYVTIAPVVGGLAHRLPRRGLLVGLDLVRAGVVLLLPFVTEVWEVYVLIVVMNAASAGFTPVFQATVPDLLPEEARYTRALSLSRLAYDLESLLSPALAAALLWVVSFDALFALNGVAFLISALLVISVLLPAPSEPGRGRGIWHNATYGLDVYLRTPRLRGLLALSLAVAAAGAMVIVNTVVYVRSILGLGESSVAVALAASGAGSMAAALLLPRLLDRVPERPVMLAGGGVMAAGLLLGLAEPAFAGLLPAWALIGVGTSVVQTPAGRLLRRSCHAEDRSALFSAQFSLSHACWLITYPLAGWLGATAGLTVTFAVLSGIVMVACIAAVAVWPEGDPVEVEHEHARMEHTHWHWHDTHHDHQHEGWEGPEPHAHPHRHGWTRHRHAFVIDYHHRQWP